MRQLTLVLVLLPALALAKGKVVIDAPKPLATAIEKAIKAKYGTSKTSLSPEPTSGDVKNACREAGGASAVITARLLGAETYNVMVLNGADGSPLVAFKVKTGKKFKALSKPDAKTLLAGLAESKAPKKEEAAKPPPEEKPAEEKKPEEKKAEPVAEKPREEKPKEKERPRPTEPPAPPKEEARAEAETPRSSSEKKPTAVRVAAGIKMFSRRFGYRDDIFNRLPTYYLPVGPAIGVDLDLYPAAFITSGFAANIGLLGQFDYAVGISSKSEDGTKYSTSALNLRVSLTARVPVSILTINPFFGYAMQSYSISASNGVKPNIPNVSYGGLRGGLALKVTIFGPVAFHAQVAGTYLLSKGEISTYFPNLTAGSLDAGGALSIALFDRLEIRFAGEYQRYWYSMNPKVGDPNVAGGALDIYTSGTATVGFML